MASKQIVKKRKTVKALPIHIQIGRKRKSDATLQLKVGPKLRDELVKLSRGDGVIAISEDQLLQAIHGLTVDAAPFEGFKISEVESPPANAGPHTILDKAKDIIYGDREKAYGNPRFNLDTIAQLWTVYLRRKHPGTIGLELSANDVSQFMILLKTARLIHNPAHEDSLIDQAGYAALQHRIQEMPSI